MKSKTTARPRLPGTIVVLGVIEGVAEATASLLKLASGVLSDHMRRKKVFAVAGYAISSFIRPLTAGAPPSGCTTL
jgi:hypothetical protein